MFDSAQVIVFSLLAIRFLYWVSFSLETGFSLSVFLGHVVELFLLLLLLTQYLSLSILPINAGYWVEWVGVGVSLAGVMVMIVARKSLGTEWVSAAASRVTRKQVLQTQGIYRVVRHPIYVGFVLSVVGAELAARSWLFVSCLFLFIPAYFWAKKEERLWEKNRSKAYLAYKKQTKMLIPFVL